MLPGSRRLATSVAKRTQLRAFSAEVTVVPDRPVIDASETLPGSVPGVNQRYRPDPRPFPKLAHVDNSSKHKDIDLSRHREAEWSTDAVKQAQADNVMYSWMPVNLGIKNTVIAKEGHGPYLIESGTGKKFLDWSSGAVCINLGHTVPETVITAMVDQLRKTPFVYGDLYVTEIRCRLSALLSEIFPDPLNSFLYYNSGAEANEAAIRVARHMTGRQKNHVPPPILPRRHHGHPSAHR